MYFRTKVQRCSDERGLFINWSMNPVQVKVVYCTCTTRGVRVHVQLQRCTKVRKYSIFEGNSRWVHVVDVAYVVRKYFRKYFRKYGGLGALRCTVNGAHSKLNRSVSPEKLPNSSHADQLIGVRLRPYLASDWPKILRSSESAAAKKKEKSRYPLISRSLDFSTRTVVVL